MQKEQLLTTCRKLISDMEAELKENDIGDALEDLHEIFTHLKSLEDQIDILSPDEEKKLDNIIEILGNIDVDKIHSVKDIIAMVENIQKLLAEFKSKILLGKTEEMMVVLQDIRSLLEILMKKI